MAFILSMSDSESPLDGAVGSTAMDLKLGKLGNIAKKRRINTFEILEEKNWFDKIGQISKGPYFNYVST